jgi:hypothetical protein
MTTTETQAETEIGMATGFARRLREEGWSKRGATLACSTHVFINGQPRVAWDATTVVAEVWAEPMRCPGCGVRWPGAGHDCPAEAAEIDEATDAAMQESGTEVSDDQDEDAAVPF